MRVKDLAWMHEADAEESFENFDEVMGFNRAAEGCEVRGCSSDAARERQC